MKNLIYLISAALLLSIAASSCEDDKKSAELLKQSTEIAMQRTDSFNQVRKDSLAKVAIREKRRSDSLRRVDSLRRIYERNNITISGKVGENSATLTMRRNNDVDGVTGTFTTEGKSVRVSGTFNDRVRLSGKQQIDSVSSLRVSISLTRVENQFSGQVTFDRDGNSYTRQAIMHRY
ncbi:MAG: hypothetical protein IKI36_03455 [Prevotella sp.]|nr:hypothetical protein [Prevotella sp.]